VVSRSASRHRAAAQLRIKLKPTSVVEMPPHQLIQLAPHNSSDDLSIRGHCPLLNQQQNATDHSMLSAPTASSWHARESTLRSTRETLRAIIGHNLSIWRRIKEGECAARMDGQTRAAGIPRQRDVNPIHSNRQHQQKAISHPRSS